MTVKKCPECNGDVSTKAKACPHCGARRSLTSTVALWAGCLVLICIAGVVSTLGGLSPVRDSSRGLFDGLDKRPGGAGQRCPGGR